MKPIKIMFSRPLHTAIRLVPLLLLSMPALAGGRLPGSGGVSQLEGSAGGGLVPWALIGGSGSADETGGSVFMTRVQTPGFTLDSRGAALGIHNRVEVSVARQHFDLGSTVPGQSIEQDIVGLKVRLSGDAISDQDRWLPQLAIGAQHKRNRDFAGVPQALGGVRGSDTDYYLAATKIWLNGVGGHITVLNATARRSRANQMGLLGFGGDRNDKPRWLAEASAALFINDRLLAGAEYRQKPDNLSAFREQAFSDVFVSWLPDKRVTVTAAWARLGNIADKPDQQGPYLSLQGVF